MKADQFTILEDMNISAKQYLSMIANYLSSQELEEFVEYVKTELE